MHSCEWAPVLPAREGAFVAARRSFKVKDNVLVAGGNQKTEFIEVADPRALAVVVRCGIRWCVSA